jgi:uncharacterized protein involved in exopolysaccharide biosynthesis
VSFKEQLYSELQSQLTQKRLDLQRRQPVATVVEEPVPPVEPSAPDRTLVVLMSLVLGGVLAIGAAFGSASLEDAEEDEEEQKKLTEIRERLIPDRWQEEQAAT